MQQTDRDGALKTAPADRDKCDPLALNYWESCCSVSIEQHTWTIFAVYASWGCRNNNAGSDRTRILRRCLTLKKATLGVGARKPNG